MLYFSTGGNSVLEASRSFSLFEFHCINNIFVVAVLFVVAVVALVLCSVCVVYHCGGFHCQ